MTVGAILASADMAYEDGQYSYARQLADRVRQIRERTFGPEHYALVGSWIFAARLDIAQGKLDDAGTDMDRAAQIIAKALPPDHFSNIDVLAGRTDVARALGKPADAERYARDAVAIAEKLFEPDHPVRRTAVDRLIGAFWVQGKFADAEHLQREELNNIDLKRGPDHPSTAVAARSVANVLGSWGRQSEATALNLRALAIDERSFGPQSDQAASDHFALGSLLRRTGKFDDARIEINLARNAWEGQGHVLAANSALEQLALLAFDQGSPAEGVVFVERMRTVAEQTFGPDSPALAAVLAQLGRLYVATDRIDAADKVLVRINSLIGDNPSEQAPGYLNVLQLRAQLDAERGNIDDAEAGFVRAVAAAAKYGGLQGNAVGYISFNLAAVYLKAGRFQDAIKNYVIALDIFKRENGDRAPLVGYTLFGAAQAYAKIGDQASSKALLATATEILGPTFAAQRPPPKWL
jgi:tetratricopeptide (TPR) repeat protein